MIVQYSSYHLTEIYIMLQKHVTLLINKMDRWTDDKVFALIDLHKWHKCLYNVKHTSYKNRISKMKLLKRLLNVFTVRRISVVVWVINIYVTSC